MKGGPKGDIEIAEVLMCYQSFTSEDFKTGGSYVLPLVRRGSAGALAVSVRVS
jgi:hypothetical protein